MLLSNLRAALFSGLASLMVSPLSFAQSKSLIELGYDIPDTAYMRDNIGSMKNEPMNGVVYSARPNTGVNQEFTTGAWGSSTFTRSSMQHAVNELQATNFGNYNQNFLRLNMQPGNMDWFDDTSSIVANAATAAWLTKQGNTKGIFFDAEPYDFNLWKYPSQKYRFTKSYSQYAAQVRQIGSAVMNAMQAESPDITLFLPQCYSSAFLEAGGVPSKLSTTTYGLLPSFLDGMLDVAGDGVKFIDGYEQAYGFRNPSQFQAARTFSKTGVLPIVENDAKYAEKFKTAFPVWIDQNWRDLGGFHTLPSEFGMNYYTPTQLQQTVSLALQYSDQYVWLYNETLFFRPDFRSPQVPQAYLDALHAAVPEPVSGSVMLFACVFCAARRRAVVTPSASLMN